MRLLDRRPREVYRVYSEDEYLNGAGSERASLGEWPPEIEPANEWATGSELIEAASIEIPAGECPTDRPFRPARRALQERRMHRVVGVAMLTGALGAVGGVVVLNGSSMHRGAARGSLSLSAATRPRLGGSPPAAPHMAPARPAIARPDQTRRSHAPRAGRAFARRRPNSHRADRPHAHIPAGARGSTAVAIDYVPPPPSDGSPAASGTAEWRATTTAATGESSEASAPTSDTTRSESKSGSRAESGSGSGNQAEFGFER